MIITASRDKAFQEPFSFKNEKGQPLPMPVGNFRLTLERGDFIKEFDRLPTWSGSVVWKMTADEMAALPYSTLYFVLYFNDMVVTRGVMRVQ